MCNLIGLISSYFSLKKWGKYQTVECLWGGLQKNAELSICPGAQGLLVGRGFVVGCLPAIEILEENALTVISSTI